MDRMTTFFLGNWATRCYLFAVAVAAVIMIGADLATGSHEPAANSIWLIALTAPVSVIFAPIFLLNDGWQTIAMLWLSVACGVLLNTLLINTIVGKLAFPHGRHTER
ncbi:MAG: hypothetical protein ABW000_20145 [Actinoplanes sp.]